MTMRISAHIRAYPRISAHILMNDIDPIHEGIARAGGKLMANEMWKLYGGDTQLADKVQRQYAYETMVEVARFAIAADQLVPATARDRLWHLVSDAGQHLGLRLAEVCETLYEAQGPSAIYDFVAATHPETPWLDCAPCETSTPHEDLTCLVCSTPREST